MLVVTLVALVLRLVWNLAIHPPGEFITSDMRSYWGQSSSMLNFPYRKEGSAIFFPYGTATLLTAVRYVFGAENHVALGIAYACLGTLLVPLVYYLAERLTKAPLLPRIAAIIACFYYPWISLGGYYLSELPFAVCVTAAALCSLRLVDRGRGWDAFIFGAAVAIGLTIRPQIILSIPLMLVVWAFRRRAWRGLTAGNWIRLALPIMVVAGISMARFHHHTGRWGFVSGNSPLNYAFGRCHALVIEARLPNYYSAFTPPPMGYLEKRNKRLPDSFVRLDPAFGTKVSVRGTMWNPAPFEQLAQKCVEKTGPWRQVRYAIVHVIMLWGFNNLWPDSATDTLRYVMLGALSLHNVFLLPPLIVMLAASFRRRFARHALLSLHIAALVAVAVVYFGDVRYRAPYDGIIIALGLDGWRRIHGFIASRAWRAWV